MHLNTDYYNRTSFWRTGMAVRKIITLSDERLRQKAKKVKQFTPALKHLAEDMLETMRSANGVGLAGPQIGVMQRIFVAEIPASRSGTDEPHPQSGVVYVLVNPEIVKCADSLAEGREGCLSIPTWYGLVERPEWVEVRAQDLDGKRIKLKVDDLLARVFQHEIDHLDGVLFLDHIRDREKVWQVLPEEEQTPEAELVEATV
jgi:peptide deformylase